MVNKIEQMMKIILNKKFMKKHTAGYDPLEVDKFLDEILKFQNILKSEIESIQKINSEDKNNIIILEKKLVQENEKKNILETQISNLLKDGYQSHNIRKEIQDIKKRLDGK